MSVVIEVQMEVDMALFLEGILFVPSHLFIGPRCHDSRVVHTTIIIIVLKLVQLFHVVQQIGPDKLDASPNPDEKFQVLAQ